jgi:NAD(P)-dependent dehydrogenase (short-subunit alcohol dehydrogenase family)
LSGDPLLDLRDKVALVTGGSSGIGAGAARALARRGATVAIGARPANVERAEAFARGLPGGAFVAPFDVRSVDDTRRGIGAVAERAGSLDVLVNSAGTNVQQLARDVDEETWDLILDTNLKGLFFACQAAAEVMDASGARADDPAAMVNVASQMGFVGWHHRAAYSASKAGVVNLTRALAVEWAGIGIRVNGVAPGFVETPLAAPMLADRAFREEVLERTPNRRIATVDDVAGAILYLCSPAARHITGHTLVIDGGWTAW